MRHALRLTLAVALLGWNVAVHAQEPTRRILAVSGTTEPGRHLMRYLLSLTGKKEPRICFVPSAGGDSAAAIVRWYEIMNQLPCRPRHQRVFVDSRSKKFEDELLSADAIWVGGGNTLNMLAIWKAQGIDSIMRRAWEKGIILAGESAGALCWFEQGITDSRPAELTSMDALGFLPGSFAPHYDIEKKRRPAFHKLIEAGQIKEGFGCDDETALLFEGTKLTRILSARANAKVYRVGRTEGKVVETPIAVEYIGPPNPKAEPKKLATP